MNIYKSIVVEKIVRSILLFTCFVEIVKGFFKYDLIEKLSTFKYGVYFKYTVYFTIFICFLVNITNRNFYLPFLGTSVYPTHLMQEILPKNASLKIKINNVIPNTKIVYWASYSKNDVVVDNPWKAYDDYSNSGIASSNKDGIVIVQLRKPVSYRIPSGSILKPHVHYREMLMNGLLGPVKTFHT